MATSLAILDYGMGNLHSAAKACEHVAPNTHITVTQSPEIIGDADKVLFPGVGAISACMQGLKDHNLLDALQQALAEKPVLAICIGMQALMRFSDENEGTDCLNFFDAQVENLPLRAGYKIPHMGWNQVTQTQQHPLWHNIPDQSRFYFVHSYACLNTESATTIGITEHSAHFSSAVAKDRVCAVQFHPEKSHAMGLQLLKNFIEHI